MQATCSVVSDTTLGPRRQSLRAWLCSRPLDGQTWCCLGQIEVSAGLVRDFVDFLWDCSRRTAGVLAELRSVKSNEALQAALLKAHNEDAHDPGACAALAWLLPHQADHWYRLSLEADASYLPSLIGWADLHREANDLEAAIRLYGLALRAGMSSCRDLFHFGEALTKSGRRSEGRAHLLRVLSMSTASSSSSSSSPSSSPSSASCSPSSREEGCHDYRGLAAQTLALSFAIDQEHQAALGYCDLAYQVWHQSCKASDDGHTTWITRALRGVTLFRCGRFSEGELELGGLLDREDFLEPSPWLDIVEGFHLLCELFAGHVAAVQQRLRARGRDRSRALLETGMAGMASCPEGPACKLAASWVLQKTHRLESCEALLLEGSQQDDASALSILVRLARVSLLLGRFDAAVVALRRALGFAATAATSTSLAGSLLVGPAEMGLCHILMCLAVHRQRCVPSNAAVAEIEQPVVAEGVEHLRQGLRLRPRLAAVLARSCACACLASRPPSRSADVAADQRDGGTRSCSPVSSASSTSTATCFLPAVAATTIATATATAAAAIASSVLSELQTDPSHYDLDFTPEEARIVVIYYKALADNDCCGSEGVSTSTVANGTHCSNPVSTSASNSTKTSMSLLEEAGERARDGCETATAVAALPLPQDDPLRDSDFKAKPRSLAASMVTTASTTEPLSSNPSREVSCRGFPAVNLANPAFDLPPPCQSVKITDVDFQECLCGGRFSFIYRGHYRGQEVAIKVHREQKSWDTGTETDCQDLQNEIDILSQLRHPCIVSFAGACLDANSVALLMELVPGGNLHQALHVQPMLLTRIQQFAFAKDLLMALSFLHGRQPALVHLDVKSANLLISAEGKHLKLCDFELAQRVDGSQRQSLVGLESRGSPRYMSPERHDASLGPVTTAADVWSAGCVLVEIFARTLPYADCNVRQLMRTMLVLKRAPSVPKSIEAAVRGAIHCALAFQVHERLRASQILLQVETLERCGSGSGSSSGNSSAP